MQQINLTKVLTETSDTYNFRYIFKNWWRWKRRT